MIRPNLLRELDLNVPAASGFKHLASASGIVVFNERYYVIGDDELRLAMFTQDHTCPGSLVEIYPGQLPPEPVARKKVKPDFEVLVGVPRGARYPNGALLAMGSGSRELRRRGALLTLNETGDPKNVEQFDLSLLYAEAEKLVPHLNIEGAVLNPEGCLLLFNRGNVHSPENLILRCDFAALAEGQQVSVKLVASIVLESVEGVPLCITDACALDDDIIFSAVAENTMDSYEDGIVKAAALGRLNANLELQQLERFDSPIKVEGIHARREGKHIEVVMVTDADDPAIPAGLYSCSFER